MMRMLLWTLLTFNTHSLKIFEDSLSAQQYKIFYHRTAEFGPQPNTYNVSGQLQPMHPIDGCDISEYADNSKAYKDQIVMILRGNCTFSDKVYNSQLLGATAAIIGDYNTSKQEWVVMSKDDMHSIHIPAVFVPHNTYSWILTKTFDDDADALYAVIDSDGEYAEKTSTFWLAAFGIVIIVIPTLWCFIVCIALLRKRIINYAKKSKRKQHLTQIPVILYRSECDGVVSSKLSIKKEEESVECGSKKKDANDLCARLVNDENECKNEHKMLNENEDQSVNDTNTAGNNSRFGKMTKKFFDSFIAKKECYHPHNDSCAICLDEFCENEELRLLPCHHAFHRQCVDPWLLKQSELCPMCKQSIFEKTKNEQRSNSEENNGCIAKLFKACCHRSRREVHRENVANIEANLNESVQEEEEEVAMEENVQNVDDDDVDHELVMIDN